MAQILNPYIQFKDNAREAMEFYQSVLGGELDAMTFAQMGMDGDEGNKIMHSRLSTPSGFTLMASDTPSQMEFMPGTQISLSLSGDDADALRGYFEGLSAGGDVQMPLAKQMWGDEFGFFVDKFGVKWMVNIGGQQQA